MLGISILQHTRISNQIKITTINIYCKAPDWLKLGFYGFGVSVCFKLRFPVGCTTLFPNKTESGSLKYLTYSLTGMILHEINIRVSLHE